MITKSSRNTSSFVSSKAHSSPTWTAAALLLLLAPRRASSFAARQASNSSKSSNRAGAVLLLADAAAGPAIPTGGCIATHTQTHRQAAVSNFNARHKQASNTLKLVRPRCACGSWRCSRLRKLGRPRVAGAARQCVHRRRRRRRRQTQCAGGVRKRRLLQLPLSISISVSEIIVCVQVSSRVPDLRRRAVLLEKALRVQILDRHHAIQIYANVISNKL